MTILVEDADQLSRIIRRLEALDGIQRVSRRGTGAAPRMSVG
jgi:hypothetical protein